MSDLIAKLESLPPEKQAEVEEFVDGLVNNEQMQIIPKKRSFGVFKGEITVSDDFDEPLEDVKEYMYP